MMWFTADLHLGDTNILHDMDRPFDSVEEMNRKVIDAINDYKAGNDWMSAFLEDCCEIGAYTEKSGELYIQYRAYCDRMGEFTRSTTEFYTELGNRGYQRKKTKKGYMVSGLRLKIGDFMD